MRANEWSPALPLVALLLAATAGAYWPGLSGGFLFDDFPNLVHEPAWKIDRLDPEHLSQAIRGGITGNGGRPLAMLSFAINHAFTGLDPFWLKLTSLLAHLGNGALVFFLCQRLVRLAPAGTLPRREFFAPLVLAGAWLLHPLQASTVLYTVQRMEIGAATGTLAALLAYMHAREQQIGGRRAWPWLVLASMAMVFGLGFKETALLAPGFAFLVEVCILRFAGATPGRRTIGWIIFYVVAFTLALSAYLVMMLPWSDLVASYGTRPFGPVERLLTQAPVLAMYLKQILLPLPESMSFYYDNFPLSQSPWDARTFPAVIFLTGLLCTAVASWRRWPLISFGIGWFFVAHALSSNLIPLELAFEHRNYLALLGILLALVQPLCALGTRLHGDAKATLALMPVFALAMLCWVQASTWADPLRLAWTLENRNPNSPRASYGLGQQLLVASTNDPENMQWSLAKQQFRHAANLPGDPSLALHALIIMQARQDLALEPTVWEEFREALTADRLTPERASALHAVSGCRISGNCRLDESQLLDTHIAVIRRNPGSPTAHTLYANFVWNVMEDQTLAIFLQHRALLLAPTDPRMGDNLARFLRASKSIDSAVRAAAEKDLRLYGQVQGTAEHQGNESQAD